MLISIIAAMDRRGLIGDERGLPWHLPKDLRRFRAYTWGKPIIMGRRTFELIGKPLPGRLNIVLTRDSEYSGPDYRTARSFQDALCIAEDYLASTGGDEAMVIGGGKVYEEAMPCWGRAYLTVVEGQFHGTVYFPVHDLLRQRWRPAREPEIHAPDEKNPHRHSFHIIERVWDLTPFPPPGEVGNLARTRAEPERAVEVLDLAAILAGGTMEP